jgi:hypothetical protein
MPVRMRCATCKPAIVHGVNTEKHTKPYPENQKRRDNLHIGGRMVPLKAELKETRRDIVD